MDFSFDLFDKELEILNQQLETNQQHSNNVLVLQKDPEIVCEKMKNNIGNTKKIEQQEQSEFIITEINDSETIPSKNKTLLENTVMSRREKKRLERIQRQENIKKEREQHFAEMKKQKEVPVPVIINDKKVITIEKSSKTTDIPTINKEVQTKVSQILNIEENFNSKLEIINKDYKKEITQKEKELNNKDREIEELKEKLKQENLKVLAINDKIEKELEQRLSAKLKKQKELDSVEKQKKTLDKRIKEQQIQLKKGEELLKKKELEFKKLEKLKKHNINNIVQVVEESYIESTENNETLPDIQETVLRNKLKNIGDKSSLEYNRTLDLLRVIVKKKKVRDSTYKKAKKRIASRPIAKTIPKSVTPIKPKHKITIKSKKSKNTQDIKIKQKTLSTCNVSFDERDCVEIDNVFKNISFRFLIFRNFSIDFFDYTKNRLFSIYFYKNFKIAICKYKQELQKRKSDGKKFYREVVVDYTIIDNKFKLWCVAWNGLININKDDFIENMNIEDCGNYYNILLPNNTSFRYQKDGREIYSFKPDGKIICKYF